MSNAAVVGEARQESAVARQERLLERLRANLFLDVRSIRDSLGVSIATVRRDLSDLERRGFLRRTHGGATLASQVTRDYRAEVREVAHAEEKSRIAEAAVGLVTDGDAVLIDSGTTSLRVARLLASNPTLTFVTNGTDVLGALVAGGATRVHLIGGEYIEVNRSLGGPQAARMVRDFQVDKAILSVSSVDLRRGVISTTSPQIGCVQEAMLEVAQCSIVVADHSKFVRASLSVIAPLGRIDHIVTDEHCRPLASAAPQDIRRKMIFA